jgi:hypothetical protein
MWNIYQNSLNRWFDRVFKSDSVAFNEISGTFKGLRTADHDMFDGMKAAAKLVQQLANEALDLVALDRRDDAQKKVRASRAELGPLRLEMNRLMSKLYELRAIFIEISGM